MKAVAPLIGNVSFGALLADKAFDANWLLEELEDRGATAVILLKSLMAKDLELQVAEQPVRIAVLNGYTTLFIPVTVPVE